MIKRIFILALMLLVMAYLAAAITAFNDKPEQQVCEGMELTVKDSINHGFVTTGEIKNLLKKKHALPEGKKLSEINTRQLENILSTHPFVGNAECYFTSGGKIAIDIYQRIPVIRIISNNGDNYYIDDEGQIISAPGKPVHVPIATGFIDRKFAQASLYPLGKFLQTDKFWGSQVEQINVTSKQELELIPRIGNHVLFLGKPEDYNKKFSKLQTFYKEALNRVGWNKYKRISIEFNNQIICTKKENQIWQ